MTIITIEKIVPGGLGLARLTDGMVVLTPFVLPDEEVRVDIRRRRKGYAEAETREIIKPSNHRVIPPCPYFETCGGCKLMHADYEFQTLIKESCLREVVEHGLKGGGGPQFEFVNFMACPRTLHYRQRIRLWAGERGGLGFFQPRSHKLVNISACLLAEPVLNEVLAALGSAPAMVKWGGVLKAVELLFSPHEQQVVIIVHLKRKPRPADRQAAFSIAGNLPLVKAVWLATERAAMDGPYGLDPDYTGAEPAVSFALGLVGKSPLLMGLEAGGFCQVNLTQNAELVKLMLAWAKGDGGDRVLDLYCGLGNFSLPLAPYVREVTGIDIQRSTIRSAEQNARRNKIQNCRFIRADVGEEVKRLAQDGERFDLLILDPPRQGCKEILPYLPAFGAHRLLYVSCDPATLVRDLGNLADCGYQLEKIRGLDMFPQTSHMETIALLIRQK